MEKQIKLYGGDLIASYKESDEKKQRLWDAFIDFCTKHEATNGECIQNDDFVINSPQFISEAIDDIISFNVEWKV